MFGVVNTSALFGIDGKLVLVEADWGDGLPSFDMVGFLGAEVKEARERVKAALKNSGYQVPMGRLTVNLSPADLRKQGNYFDLPIAIAILIAIGIIPQEYVKAYSFVGELSLDGRLRGINGTLSHVICAADFGKTACIVPYENGQEGAVIGKMPVYGMKNLRDVVEFLLKNEDVSPVEAVPDNSCINSDAMDFSDIQGQEGVKRAMEVASAGMHGILLIGPPGSGKTLTAKRVPTILPPLTMEERIETSKIYSVSGLMNPSEGLIKARPFRSPHHTISSNALVGGGMIPKPGEMSLAHNGVLFLDELPEFSKMTLEVMRQPLEDKRVMISRVHGTYTFPTRVMLIAAMNPCKCGYYPDRKKCRCSDVDVHRYLGRISKPLLDRMDILVEAPRVTFDQLRGEYKNESSASIRERVIKAWEIQKKRYEDEHIVFNSQLDGKMIRKYCGLGYEEQTLMESVFEKLDFSARAYDRVLKVARTIADLSGEERISKTHLAEAIGYRSLDRKFWGNQR